MTTGSPGGTTKTISLELIDFKPAAAPLIVNVTPESSIGKVKLLDSEPTAARGTAGLLTSKGRVKITSIPGDTPCTAGGVIGVGETVGVGLGVGVAAGVGTGEAETGMRLAPVAKFRLTVRVDV